MSGSLRYTEKKLAIRTCLAGSKNTLILFIEHKRIFW